jgi:hypothetical protein
MALSIVDSDDIGHGYLGDLDVVNLELVHHEAEDIAQQSCCWSW